jgi:6-phosphogluconolactonase
MARLRYNGGVDVELYVVEDAEAAAAAAADRLVAAVRGGGNIALSGGSTPSRAYEIAAAAERNWRSSQLWLGDERLVPPEDDRANARLVSEALLSRVRVERDAFHRVQTDLPPDDAAAAYADELAQAGALRFALMGLGPDGHTASLFPNARALDERERLVVAAEPGLPPWVTRVTMTIPAFAAAAEVVYLAVGAEKADAARRAFAEPPSRATPASLVRSAAGRTIAVLDREAASLL